MSTIFFLELELCASGLCLPRTFPLVTAVHGGSARGIVIL